MNIRVSNIDRSTSEDELRQLFEEFGDVDFVEKNEDPDEGKLTFSAQVVMNFESEALEAISELNGEYVDGKPIQVVRADHIKQPVGIAEEDAWDDEDSGGDSDWEPITRKRPKGWR